MKIFPIDPKISSEDGFTNDADIFGYKDFGLNLIKLFDVSEDVFVSVIDGSWGIGKTTFIEMLAGEFRNQNFPTIYFDAFENDYLDDPFVAISSEIIELAQTNKLARKSAYKKFVQSAGKTALQVSKTSAKVAAKAVTLGVLKNDDLDLLDDIASDLGKIAEDSVEKSVEELLKSRKEQKNNIQKFNDSLIDLVGLLSPEVDKPLIFIIDELDRCRPDFALGLLERIKHFYRVEKVYFILVANLEQLSHSVCARYGSGIDGQNYLHKFYDLKFDLIPSSRGSRQEVYWNMMSKQANVSSRGKTSLIIKSWASFKGISLRELQKIFVVKQLVFVTWEPDWYPEIISILCIAKVLYPSIFSKLINENAQIEDLEVGIELLAWASTKQIDDRDSLFDDVIDSWRYLLDKNTEVPDGRGRLDVHSYYGSLYQRLQKSFQLVS